MANQEQDSAVIMSINTSEPIALVPLAEDLGCRKQTLFK
jgi:hypothetical protein